MDIYFRYTSLGTAEIMSGVFYDADLDPSLTNSTITEELSLTTTRSPVIDGSDVRMWANGITFDSSNPVTGITSNDTNVTLSLGIMDTSSIYFTEVGVNPTTGNDITMLTETIRIKSFDGELESPPLEINSYCINNLPKFDVKFKDSNGSEISTIDIVGVGDIFKVYISGVQDVEDGGNYLRGVFTSDPSDIPYYVKTRLRDLGGKGRSDDLDIPGFSKTVEYSIERQELTVTYECNDIADVQTMGSQVLSIALYDSMGVQEQQVVTDETLHKNRTIKGSFILNVVANNIVVSPITRPTVEIAGTVYNRIQLTDTVSEGLSVLSIPFIVTTDSSTVLSVGLVMDRDGSIKYIDDERDIQCILEGSGSASAGTITPSNGDIVFTNYASPTASSFEGVLNIPVKNRWWGDFNATLYIGAGNDGVCGIGSAQWKITVSAVNNTPELLI